MIVSFDLDENDEIVYALTLENGQEIEVCVHGNHRYILTEFGSFPFDSFNAFVLDDDNTEGKIIINEYKDELKLSKVDCDILSTIIKME